MMQTDLLQARQSSFKKPVRADDGIRRREKELNQIRKQKKDEAIDNRRGRFSRDTTTVMASLESYNDSDVAIQIRGFRALLAADETDADRVKTRVELLRQISSIKNPSIIAQLKIGFPDFLYLMAKINNFIESQNGQIQEKWGLAHIQENVAWILLNIVLADPSSMELLASSDDNFVCLIKALLHECHLPSSHYALIGILRNVFVKSPSSCESHEQLLVRIIMDNGYYHERFTSAEKGDVVTVVQAMLWLMNDVASSIDHHGKLATSLEKFAIFIIKNRHTDLPNIGIPSDSGILAFSLDVMTSLAAIKESLVYLIQHDVASDLADVLACHVKNNWKVVSSALECLDALFQDKRRAILDVVLRSIEIEQVLSVLEAGPGEVKKKALALLASMAGYAPENVISHHALFGTLVRLAGRQSAYPIRLAAIGALRNVFLGASRQELELDASLGGFKAMCDAIGDHSMKLPSNSEWTLLKAIYQALTRVDISQVEMYKEVLEISGAAGEIEHIQNDEDVKVAYWSNKIYEILNSEADENASPDTSGVAKTLFQSPSQLQSNQDVGTAFTSRKNY